MNKKFRKLLVAAVVVSMILTQMLGITAFAAPTSYAGADRYATALKISATYASASTVVLANGEEPADALSATPYAYSVKAPILLTGAAALPAGVLAEIARLGATTVVIAGGTGAVSQAIADQLTAAGYTVDRVSGADRYATSLAFAQKLGTTANGVVIANGYAFADALSIAPIAAFKGMPIVLTAKDALTADAAAFVAGKTGYIVGGTAVVGEVVSGATRLAGTDRYDTNDKIIENFAADLDFSNIYLATGENGADALAGSVVAATAKAPLVLVGSALNAKVKAFLADKVTTDTAFFVLGGASAVLSAAAALEVKAPATLSVEKVTALSGGQLEITFSKEIDKDSVIDDTDTLVDGLFTISRVPVGTDANLTVDADTCFASLSDDGKVLTITPTDDGTYFDGTYSLYIDDGITTKVGENMGSYRTTFAVDDTVAPKVTSVTYNSGSDQFEVVMSEPCAIQPSIRIDNDTPAAIADVNDARTKFTIANTADKGSTVDVNVYGAEDYLGNVQDDYSKSVKVDMDENPVTVSTIEQDSSNSVKVVFDKAIEGGDDAAAAQDMVQGAITVLRKGVDVTGDITSVERDGDDSTNRTFYVNFDEGNGPDYVIYPTDENKATLNFNFADGALTDVYGNTNSEINKSVSMTKDEAAPKLVGMSEGSDNQSLLLRFDENVRPVDLTGITVRKDGVDVTDTFDAAATRLDAAGEVAVEDITSAKWIVLTTNLVDGDGALIDLAAGTYTVHVPDSAFSDKHENENDAFNTSTTVSNTDSTVTVLTVEDVVGAENEWVMTFDGEVGNSALSPSSYTLNGAKLPESTDIYFVNADKEAVHIALDSDTVNYSDDAAYLRNIAVKDSNGNKVSAVSADDSAVTVVDNTAPTLVSASLSGNVLTLTFNESMGDGVTAIATTDELITNFEVKGGSNATLTAGGDVVTQVDGKKVMFIITAGDSNWSTVKNYSTIKVKTLAPDTDAGETEYAVDANGIFMNDGTTVSVTK